jgi:hypothetical protein
VVWTCFKYYRKGIMDKVLNMKVKGKKPSWRSASRWKQQCRKCVTWKEELGKKLRRNCGKRDLERLGCEAAHL